MKLRVNYRDYEITDWTREDGLANSCFGKCDTNTGKIYVDVSLADDKRANTAIHEVLHAIWREMAIEDADEESHVSAVANGLTQVFRDNPKFVKHIQSLLSK